MKASETPEAAIFEAALVCLSPERRAADLDRACADNPELRSPVEAPFIPEPTAKRWWAYARAWLFAEIRKC